MMSRGKGFAENEELADLPRLRKINLYPCANRFLIGFPTGEDCLRQRFRSISSGKIPRCELEAVPLALYPRKPDWDWEKRGRFSGAKPANAAGALVAATDNTARLPIFQERSSVHMNASLSIKFAFEKLVIVHPMMRIADPISDLLKPKHFAFFCINNQGEGGGPTGVRC